VGGAIPSTVADDGTGPLRVGPDSAGVAGTELIAEAVLWSMTPVSDEPVAVSDEVSGERSDG